MPVNAPFIMYVGSTAYDLRKVSSAIVDPQHQNVIWVRFLDNNESMLPLPRDQFEEAWQIALEAEFRQLLGMKAYKRNGPPQETNSWTINHNLNTLDVIVQVIDRTTNSNVLCGIVRNDANSVTLTFGSPIQQNLLRVLIVAIP